MIMARTLHFDISGKRDVRRVAVAREHRTAAWHTSHDKERYSTQQKAMYRWAYRTLCALELQHH